MAVPLYRPDGSVFGTLCAFDPTPGELPERHLAIFRKLADLITLQLEQRDEREDRERFIGALAHDLRTPLQTITTASGVLSAHENDRLAAMGQRLGRSASQLADMTDSILDFARGRFGGGLPCAPRPTDLARLALNTIETLPAIRDRVRLRVTGDPGARVDPSLITRLLQNLVRNAFEHGAEGAPVEVAIDGEAHELVVIEVANRGPAIPAELVPFLFRPFRRGPAQRGSGLGLGLYIASEVCTAHGGALTADSQNDRTVFRARLPRG